MSRAVLLAVPLVIAAVAAEAQTAVYQSAPRKAFTFAGDTLARYEWTNDIPTVDGLTKEDRYRLQARPRVEINVGPFELGVGGDFDYSSDENDKPPAGQTTLLIIRDNYRSRDARLDLAWGKVTAGPVTIQGGRFFMPLPLTEMIWDQDLRPQGGAAAIDFTPRGSSSRLGITGIYAKGSHVFEDESVMFGGGLDLSFATGAESRLQLAGSYLQFQDLDRLDPRIRRQNTHVGGFFPNEYKVVDVVGRVVRGGQVPVQLVADYCWNTGADTGNRGLWLAAVLGALGVSPARLEYTYAKIDRDATVAAFNTDDFFWGTGWEGHRADLATGTVKSSSIHAIAQWQRFKDSTDATVRDQWVKRFRLEWRTSF
jgi:hypothetical protein